MFLHHLGCRECGQVRLNHDIQEKMITALSKRNSSESHDLDVSICIPQKMYTSVFLTHTYPEESFPNICSDGQRRNRSKISTDRLPYNRSKICHCNSWQMHRILVWHWLSQQYLVPQACVAGKKTGPEMFCSRSVTCSITSLAHSSRKTASYLDTYLTSHPTVATWHGPTSHCWELSLAYPASRKAQLCTCHQPSWGSHEISLTLDLWVAHHKTEGFHWIRAPQKHAHSSLIHQHIEVGVQPHNHKNPAPR